MKKFLLSFIIFLVFSLILGSILACKPKVRLPEDSSLAGSNQWLVVASLYCQMKDSPSRDSVDLGILRKGSVLKISESAFSTDEKERGVLWFKVQSGGQPGWVSIRDVQTYSSETQARDAALRME